MIDIDRGIAYRSIFTRGVGPMVATLRIAAALAIMGAVAVLTIVYTVGAFGSTPL